MATHPNRALTEEQRNERRNRRLAALQVSGQVHAGSNVSAETLAAYAQTLMHWVDSGKTAE